MMWVDNFVENNDFWFGSSHVTWTTWKRRCYTKLEIVQYIGCIYKTIEIGAFTLLVCVRHGI